MTFIRSEGRHDLSNEVYHSDVHYFSSSQLKEALESPAHFKHYIIDKHGKHKTTKAMELGTLIHTLVLEPHKFDDEYIVCDGETTENGALTAASFRAFKARTPHLHPISKQWYEIATRARARFKNHPEYAALLYSPGCEYEVSYFIHCKETGLRLRIRPDCINVEQGYIVDLKSTADVSEHSFLRDVKYNFHYDLSSFMYKLVAYQLFNKIFDFYWACAGTESLVPAAMYKVSAERDADGKAKFFKAVDNIKTALTIETELVFQDKIKEI